ncbi:DUF3305 domain-containing protein [Coralliovum pocilloporae]|uniref:DUF3305 domain-containing protein n=1 Tax=Coralliovum pocilloporae TaxID=3066369 RepID=UPI003307C60C
MQDRDQAQDHGQSQSIPLGVVLRRAPGVTRWAKWTWKAVAVLPGAGDADWAPLREEGDISDFHAATLSLELFSAETEAYLHGLAANIPAIYVVMRKTSADHAAPLDVVLVTASPYEAQDYADSGEEIVEKVAMPDGLIAWIQDFINQHHEEEVFVKRRRDKKRIDLVEDGIGDPRIRQISDVYRAPRSKSASRNGKEQVH